MGDGPKISAPEGYDAPAERDVLGRWSFARRIAEIIEQTPLTQSVRIGVYGTWGTGKTSVLNFVTQLVERSEHLVVKFSPWGLTSPQQMWTALARALVTSLEAANRTGANQLSRWEKVKRFKLKHADRFQKVFAEAQRFKDVSVVAKGVSVVATPLLGPDLAGLLRVTAEELAAIAGNTRVVVLVDDLDRTDPSLVPHLLFALRELFDTQRFTWILSIDPLVIREALAAYHKGFVAGSDFLEKIIEFPFWLPQCDRDQLWSLAELDLRRFGSAIPERSIKGFFELFPTNPRQLRGVVRHILSLKGVLSRFDSDEIDYELLVLIVLLHCADAEGLRRALADGDALSCITDIRLRLDRGDTEGLEKAADEAADKLSQHFSSPDKPRIKQLLRRLGTAGWWADETIIQHARLLESPPDVTMKEAREALASYLDTPTTLGRWCDAFRDKTGVSPVNLARALFGRALVLYRAEVEAATDAFGDEGMKHRIDTAKTRLQFLLAIASQSPGVPPAQVVTSSLLRDAYAKVMEWVDFTHPADYLALRQDEAAVIRRLFEILTEVDPFESLDLLAPWKDWHHDDSSSRQKARQAARQPLLADVLPLAGRRALNLFAEANAIATTIGSEDRASHRYLLFRRSSPVWNSLRAETRTVLSGLSDAVADNATDFLQALLSRQENGFRGGEIGTAEVAEFIRDHEAMGWLWEAATRVIPNMRRFKGLADLRQALADATGKQPAVPPWWSWKEQQWKDATRPPASGTAIAPDSGTNDSEKA
jgi:hypothetical protein